MYDFKFGDRAQIDPALVNGGLCTQRGVGVITSTGSGGTQTKVTWKDGTQSCVPARDLVPVAQTREPEE